ncbi:hypothetical protein GCM10010176_024030 [Nonomuraea spiralis]|nr:hypothetical protein GCM10010176_024030 [Nonomuraea spiralis]
MTRFVIGDGYAAYEGPSSDNSLHRHAAFQVTAAVEGEVVVLDEHGTAHRGAALVIPPMVRHRMPGAPIVRMWFVEPQCSFASALRERCGAGITPAADLRGLREEDVRPAGPPRRDVHGHRAAPQPLARQGDDGVVQAGETEAAEGWGEGLLRHERSLGRAPLPGLEQNARTTTAAANHTPWSRSRFLGARIPSGASGLPACIRSRTPD